MPQSHLMFSAYMRWGAWFFLWLFLPSVALAVGSTSALIACVALR